MQPHIVEEWRIRDIEQKANNAANRLYELDSLRCNMDSLERQNRELSACVDGLRSTLEACLERIERLEQVNV